MVRYYPPLFGQIRPDSINMRQYAGKFALIFPEFSEKVHKKQGVYGTLGAATDQVIEKLCEELNATETVFPRTNLRLVLQLGST